MRHPKGTILRGTSGAEIVVTDDTIDFGRHATWIVVGTATYLPPEVKIGQTWRSKNNRSRTIYIAGICGDKAWLQYRTSNQESGNGSWGTGGIDLVKKYWDLIPSS